MWSCHTHDTFKCWVSAWSCHTHHTYSKQLWCLGFWSKEAFTCTFLFVLFFWVRVSRWSLSCPGICFVHTPDWPWSPRYAGTKGWDTWSRTRFIKSMQESDPNSSFPSTMGHLVSMKTNGNQVSGEERCPCLLSHYFGDLGTKRNWGISGNWEKCLGYRSMGASGPTPDCVSRNQRALIYQGLWKEKRLVKANPYPDL